MSTVESSSAAWAPRQGEPWQQGYAVPERPRDEGGVPWGLLVTGMTVAALGVIVWNHFGADVRRYLKMRSM